MQVVVFDIKKNHAIVAWYDEETGEKTYKPVVRLSRSTTKEWYHIRVNGEEIVCTGGHPFYVLNAEEDRKIVRYEGVKSDKKGRWIEAKELKKDDKLLLSDGSYGIINSVAVETLESPETTYNFEVEDFHTYFVSDSNVLVHNRCGTPDTAPDDFTKLKNGQGWRDKNGNVWKKDMLHKDHWDVSNKKGVKIKEIDFKGNQIWPGGPKNKNKW